MSKDTAWGWFKRRHGRAVGRAAVRAAARVAGAVGGGSLACLALELLARVDGDRDRAAVLVREIRA